MIAEAVRTLNNQNKFYCNSIEKLRIPKHQLFGLLYETEVQMPFLILTDAQFLHLSTIIQYQNSSFLCFSDEFLLPLQDSIRTYFEITTICRQQISSL